MRIRKSIATFATLVALGCGAFASDAAAVGKGAVEIAPSASFEHNTLTINGTDSGSITTAFGDLQVGYFITDMIEIGGGFLVTYVSDNPAGSAPTQNATSFGLQGAVTFNFSTSGTMVPFVRAGAGFASNSGDLAAGTETTILAPIVQGGFRWMVAPAASVNFGVGYRHETDTFGVANLAANNFHLFVGMSLFPRTGE